MFPVCAPRIPLREHGADTSIRSMDRSGTQLDDTDRAIIERLQADGRIPYTRLGAAVGLSEAAVRQRVQRMTDAGVMQVVAVTNPLSLGLRRMAMIGVRTAGPTDDLAKTLQAMVDIDYLVVTAGSFDFMCEVVVEDDGVAARTHQPDPFGTRRRLDRDLHLPRPRQADLRLGRALAVVLERSAPSRARTLLNTQVSCRGWP